MNLYNTEWGWKVSWINHSTILNMKAEHAARVSFIWKLLAGTQLCLKQLVQVWSDLLVAIVLLFFFCALLLLKSSDLKITKKLYVAIFLLQIVLLRVFVWLCGCLTLCLTLLFSERWPYVLKQTCSFQLQLCLSINEIFMDIIIKGLIVLSDNVEVNRRPKNNYIVYLYICRVFPSVQFFFVIFLSVTHLNSTVSLHDENLVIPNYNLVLSDHPSNAKRRDTKNYICN